MDPNESCACTCGGTPATGRRFITGHNLRLLDRRSATHRQRIAESARIAWSTKRKRKPLGSRRLDVNGYVLIKVREGGHRWDKEHVLEVEKAIGRRMVPGEEVHHLNGVKTDNRIDNLLLCATKSEHALVHASFGALLPELMAAGVVVFDRETGRYRRA